MKRYIRSADITSSTHGIFDYARKTRRDEIEFDIPQIWSIQFYGKSSDLIDDCEVYVMAKTYDEAVKQAKYLCKVWDYDYDACVIQFAYRPRQQWNKHPVKLEGNVQYIED